MYMRLAQPEDAPVVASVLSAAAATQPGSANERWSPGDLTELAVLPHIRSGLYHMGWDGADALGVFRLQLQDPDFWPEMPVGTSTYLHKLAVVPSRQGQGLAHELLLHAARLTRAQGFRYLRLDCMGGRPKLRAVYEGFGFRHHSQKLLGGQVFERFEFDVGAPDA